jgi:ribonuclease BN (tRNA processing enzyme)
MSITCIKKNYKAYYPIVFFIIASSFYIFGIIADANAQAKQPQKVHEKSLSVITIGSGVPGGGFANRAESMTVIQNKGKYVVLDCGYTSVMKLMKEKIPMKNIGIIMFTHLHADHSSDFINLLINRYVYGGKELDIIGPPKTRSYYDFVTNFYKDDMMYRAMVFNTGTLTGFFKGVNVREFKGSNKVKIGDISIESAEMIHTMYDLAYKFIIDGKTIVVSGDTSYTKSLVDFAKNADMVVLDGSFILYALEPPKVNNFDVSGLLSRNYDGKSFKDYKPGPYAGNMLVESHLNYADIIKISAEIAPKKLLLTHLYGERSGQPDPQTDKLKNKVMDDLKKAGFNGEAFFAQDGLEVGI